MNKQVKYILFLVLLLATSLFAKPFSVVRVAKKEKISETAFSIDFAWVDENEYLGFEPGDLIELKKDKEIHTRHIYSPSKFPTDEDPTIQITVDKSVQESRIRHFYPRMSTGLSNADIGDQNFKLRVLKTGLQQKLLERPLVMIAGGWAITVSYTHLGALYNPICIDEDNDACRSIDVIFTKDKIFYGEEIKFSASQTGHKF